MKTYRKERNWSQYNQKLKKIASIEFYVKEEEMHHWHNVGKRKPGGKQRYSNHAIELCLILKEYYQLPYRQAEGFVRSVFNKMSLSLRVPDYTTMSRRAGKLKIDISVKMRQRQGEPIIVAFDSTGLSLYNYSEWNRIRNKDGRKNSIDKWRKLHVAIDVKTGDILQTDYSTANINDGSILPEMLPNIEGNIDAVCADMAYDTINCRTAIAAAGARQLIPPNRRARLCSENRNMKKRREALKERDDAINYIRHNVIDGNYSQARANWKRNVGYHARSLVETTMMQIKRHCSDMLKSKLETNRKTESMIKCKIINMVNAA